jgi:putative ABC transport system permease protein
VIPPLRLLGLVWAEIRANRTRTAGMVACIAIAVTTFTLVVQLSVTAREGVADTVERTQGSLGTIRVTASGAAAEAILTATAPIPGGPPSGRIMGLFDANLSVGGAPTAARFAAADPGVIDVLPIRMKLGRWLTPADEDLLAVVAVLTSTTARDLSAHAQTPEAALLGRDITVEGPQPLTVHVVGVLDDCPLQRFQTSPNTVFVAFQSGQPRAALSIGSAIASRKVPAQVQMYLSAPTDPDAAQSSARTAVTTRLQSLGTPRPTVEVERIDTADNFTAATRALALILTVIGGICLIVGATGVTTVSLMSVRERTKELALRRATGARPRTLFALVLAENTAILTLGGVFGVVTAAALAAIANAPWAPSLGGFAIAPLSLSTAAIAEAASILVGVGAGLLPAWKARRLPVIEALRL